MQQRSWAKHTWIAGIALCLLASCSATRHIPEDKALFKKFKIKGIEGRHAEAMVPLVNPDPNRRLLGIYPMYLGMYNAFDPNKFYKWKFKRMIRDRIGEPPVLFDSARMERSAAQMEKYLFTKGYFRSQVDVNTRYNRRGNKARVYFNVDEGKPYKVRQVDWLSPDTMLIHVLDSFQKNALVRTGQNYDEDRISAERERIYRRMRNSGYYDFTQQYISVRVDSALGTDEVDLLFYLDLPPDSSLHKTFHIGQVRVNVKPTGYAARFERDTLVNDRVEFYNPERKIRNVVLSERIALRPGQLFRASNLEYTYNRLGDLGVFRFTDVRFDRPGDSTVLDAYIELVPARKREARIEGEGTFDAGYFGVSSNLSFVNRNAFRGGEKLELGVRGGLERETYGGNADLSEEFFNARQIGSRINLTFPEFLTPFRLIRLKTENRPFTRVGLNYGYEERPEYQRRTLDYQFGYEWRQGRNALIQANPFFVQLVQSFLTPETEALLDTLNNPILRASFQEHISMGGRYSITYNDLTVRPGKDGYFARLDLESVGGGLSVLAPVLPGNDDPKRPSLFGLPFYQYLRPELELRTYRYMSPGNILVLRALGGIGYTYSVNPVLPFERQFFSGGSSGIRAWKARRVGPGSFNPRELGTNRVVLDQTGEFKLEGNLEYRFDVFKQVKGAIFMDAGNVWTLNDANQIQGSDFSWNDIPAELAVGSGFGVRYDMEYFIIRLDVGLKVHDPSFAPGNRWVYRNFGNREFSEANQNYRFLNYNFGVGFPF